MKSKLNYKGLYFDIVKIDRDIVLDDLLRENFISDEDYEIYSPYTKDRLVIRTTIEIYNSLDYYTEEQYILLENFYIIDSEGYQHRATLFESGLKDTSFFIRKMLGIDKYYNTVLPHSKLLLDIYFQNIPQSLEITKLAYSKGQDYIIVDIDTGETITNCHLD